MARNAARRLGVLWTTNVTTKLQSATDRLTLYSHLFTCEKTHLCAFLQLCRLHVLGLAALPPSLDSYRTPPNVTARNLPVLPPPTYGFTQPVDEDVQHALAFPHIYFTEHLHPHEIEAEAHGVVDLLFERHALHHRWVHHSEREGAVHVRAKGLRHVLCRPASKDDLGAVPLRLPHGAHSGCGQVGGGVGHGVDAPATTRLSAGTGLLEHTPETLTETWRST